MGKGGKWLSLAKKAFLSKKGRDKVRATHVAIVPLVPSASSSEADDAPSKQEQLSSEQPVPATEEFDEAGCIENEEVPKAPPPPAPTPDSTATEEAEKSSEHLAAIKIQTAVRAFLAKRKLRAMLAVSKLQKILQGKTVKRQTSSAMRCMQSFTKLQTQVRLQRSRMAELEMQRRLEQGNEPERFCLSAEDWDDSTLSKEQIRAKLQTKHQAAIKRERTLAYAFSHKLWRSYPKDSSVLETDDADKPNWSWSWLEQWMVTRNWESLQEDSKSHNKQGSKSPTKSEMKSAKSSPAGVSSPRKPSRTAKVYEPQSPIIGSPARKTSTQQPASPYRSFSRKTTATAIQSAKAPAADEKHTRPSLRTPSSFFPRTPERETPASAKNWLQRKPSTKSPYCSPARSPLELHKTSKALP